MGLWEGAAGAQVRWGGGQKGVLITKGMWHLGASSSQDGALFSPA